MPVDVDFTCFMFVHMNIAIIKYQLKRKMLCEMFELIIWKNKNGKELKRFIKCVPNKTPKKQQICTFLL